MTWEPNEDQLNKIHELLTKTNSNDQSTQREVQQKYQQMTTNIQFSMYLAYILSKQVYIESIRSLSGLLLKNVLTSHYTSLPEYVISYIKSNVCLSINDSSPMVRSSIGIVITTIFTLEKGKWMDVIYFLIGSLQGEDKSYNRIDGIIGAIQKICEDSLDVIEGDVIDNLTKNVIIYINHEVPRIRSRSLNIVNNIIMSDPTTISTMFTQFITSIFALSNDTDSEVTRELCKCLSIVCESYYDEIKGEIGNIMNFMIIKVNDPNEDIALEACEFWLTMTDHAEKDKTILANILDKLLFNLIKCLKYSNEQIIALKADDNDDSSVPDKIEDIEPRFYSNKNEDTPPDEDEEEEDNGDIAWNIRKCAASTIDLIATIYKDDCLPIILPILSEILKNEEWLIKESGILCLGAISEGCKTGMEQHMGTLFNYLIEETGNVKPLIRSISCWTLSRYSDFICQDSDSIAFKRYLKELLIRMIDSNKNVQNAACSAFASLIEVAGKGISKYFKDICMTFVKCFEIYQTKNLMVLYDAIGTLVDHIDADIQNEMFINNIMPIMMDKLKNMDKKNHDCFPLLECVSSIVVGLQRYYEPFSKDTYDKCLSIIHSSIVLLYDPNTSSYDIDIEKDFIIISIELLTEMVEALENCNLSLVIDNNILPIILRCSIDFQEDIRVSTFSLLNRIIKNYPDLITNCKHEIALVVISNLFNKNPSLLNSAINSFGNLTEILKEDTNYYVNYTIPYLVSYLSTTNFYNKLAEGSSITLGKVAYQVPLTLAPFLDKFVKQWCLGLKGLEDNENKVRAFEGLIKLININIAGICNDFIYFCDAICSFDGTPEVILVPCKNILSQYKGYFGEEKWSEFLSTCPDYLKERLNVIFGV